MGAYEEFMEAKAKIEALAKSIEQVTTYLQANAEAINDLYNRSSAVNQSVVAQNATIQALAALLEEKGVVDSPSFFDKLKKINDNKDRANVMQMVEAGLIEPADEVTETGLVVLKEDLLGENGKNLSEFRSLDLTQHSPEFAKSMVGKKVGDKIENKTGDKVVEATIIEVYKTKEMKKEE